MTSAGKISGSQKTCLSSDMVDESWGSALAGWCRQHFIFQSRGSPCCVKEFIWASGPPLCWMYWIHSSQWHIFTTGARYGELEIVPDSVAFEGYQNSWQRMFVKPRRADKQHSTKLGLINVFPSVPFRFGLVPASILSTVGFEKPSLPYKGRHSSLMLVDGVRQRVLLCSPPSLRYNVLMQHLK